MIEHSFIIDGSIVELDTSDFESGSKNMTIYCSNIILQAIPIKIQSV